MTMLGRRSPLLRQLAEIPTVATVAASPKRGASTANRPVASKPWRIVRHLPLAAVSAPPLAPAPRGNDRGAGAWVESEPTVDASPRWRRLWQRLASRRLSDVRLVALLALALSIGFYVWYARQGLTLAYADAISHLMIARRVLFSRTPGLAQFGTVWLPLHHILMLPFVWITPLYRSGLAGALPSMGAYIISAVYLFRSGRLLFASRIAGWIASLTFMLNPNVLYMQGTPMSELPLLCAAIAAVYYLLRWERSGEARDVVKTAAAVACGTLIRYDGWSFALGAAALVVYIGWRRWGLIGAEARLLLFGILAFAGCAAWFVYNAAIFGDPLAFFHGAYSSLGQQEHLRATLGQPTYHHLLLSAQVYSQSAVDTVGALLAILAVAGLVNFVLRYRFRLAAWPAYLVLVPFAFNVASLYAGTSSLFTDEFKSVGLGGYYNERYGLMMVPAIALFLASWSTVPWIALRRTLLTLCVALVILLSGFNTTLGLPYVLKDPMYSGGETLGVQAGKWLSAHYQGGDVLFSYVPDVAPMFYSGLPDQVFITDSNGVEFQHALTDPQDTVTWIVLSQASETNPSPIWTALHTRQDWHHYFALRATFGTTQIYQRLDLPIHPAALPPAGARLATPAASDGVSTFTAHTARHTVGS